MGNVSTVPTTAQVGGSRSNVLSFERGHLRVPVVVLEHLRGLGELAILVYLHIAKHVGRFQERELAPSSVTARELAAKTQGSVRRVELAIAKLVANGLVVRVENPGRNGSKYALSTDRFGSVENGPPETSTDPIGSVNSLDRARARARVPISDPSPSQYKPTNSPIPGGSGGFAHAGSQIPEVDRAAELLEKLPKPRSVGGRLARNELHRLAQALLAKGLAAALVVVAAEQYARQDGPWSRWRNLRPGVTAIVEDVGEWARGLEPKTGVRRAAVRDPAEHPKGCAGCIHCRRRGGAR